MHNSRGLESGLMFNTADHNMSYMKATPPGSMLEYNAPFPRPALGAQMGIKVEGYTPQGSHSFSVV